MRRILFFSVSAVLLLFCLSGCGKNAPAPHTKEQVEQYLISQKCPDTTVSENCKRNKDDYGDYYYYWTATTTDGTEFKILDYLHRINEEEKYELYSDYETIIVKRLFETVSDSHMTLRMDTTIGDKLESATVIGEYKDIFALRSILKTLDRLSDEMKKECPCGNLYYELYFLNPLVESETEDNFAKYNVYDWLEAGEHVDTQKIVNEFIQVCLDYRFEEQISQLTEEEIQTAINEKTSTKKLRVVNGGNIPYESLYACKDIEAISYATMYRLLELNGMNPVGTPEHYTYVYKGAKYEVSYSFYDEEERGFYYLKNGVPLMAILGYSCSCHYTPKNVFDMTGIVIHLYKANYLPKSDQSAEDILASR